MKPTTVKAPPALPSKLLTAEQVSPFVYVEPERLRTMALRGELPCHRVAGGDPLFHRPTLSRFLRANYYQEQEGAPEPVPFRCAVILKAPETPVEEPLPESLGALAAKLFEYRRFYYAPCVYFLVNKSRVVYVGQTVNLPARIHSHTVGSGDTEPKHFDRVLYLPTPFESLLTVEAEFIKTLQPYYNYRAARREGSPPEPVAYASQVQDSPVHEDT